MRLSDKFKDGHLFYCLNAHPGATREEMTNGIFTEAADVWQQTGLPGEKAVGMWINNDLSHSFDAATFGNEMKEAGLYCVSLNGFPFGVFHGKKVKQEVYRPDWSDQCRLNYTCRLADILAELLPEGEAGTISTLPVTYRQWASSRLIRKALKNLNLAATYLQDLHSRTGKKIMLCLEPEPDCFLDSSVHAARWFSEELLPINPHMREYVGICLDTVHCGVLFEQPNESLRLFSNEGIRIGKVQIGAALSCMGKYREQLHPFAEPVYLHQTRICEYGGIVSYGDLHSALAAGGEDDGEWRVHFHVPLSWDGDKELDSTSDLIDREFLLNAYAAGCRHFEAEVYTLNVFPEKISINEVLASELKILNFLMGRHV